MKTTEADTEPELTSEGTAKAAQEAIAEPPPPPPRIPLPHEAYTYTIHAADDASRAPRVPGEAVITVHSREGIVKTLYGATDLNNDDREALESLLTLFSQKASGGKT